MKRTRQDYEDPNDLPETKQWLDDFMRFSEYAEKQEFASFKDPVQRLRYLKEHTISRLEWYGKWDQGRILANILVRLPLEDMIRLNNLGNATVTKVITKYNLIQRVAGGKLWTLGQGSEGRLGDGIVEPHDGVKPFQVGPFPFEEGPVIQVACGDMHTLVVLKNNGAAYGFGSNTNGELGHEGFSLHPLPIPIMSGIAVAMVACGASHSALVTRDEGMLFTFGQGALGRLGDGDELLHERAVPFQVNIDEPVKMVSCGRDYTSCVTTEGRGFSFGSNDTGCLGIGSDVPLAIFPTPIVFEGGAIASITCGDTHAALIALEDERCYAYGRATSGQLGLGKVMSDEFYLTWPKFPMNLPERDNRVVSVVCGSEFTVIVTSSGFIYTTGLGSGGTLGDGNTSYHTIDVPVRRKLPDGEFIVSVSASHLHVAALSAKGALWVWGEGRHGVLGDGNANPHPVTRPTQIFFPYPLASAICGRHHTALVSRHMESMSVIPSLKCMICGQSNAGFISHQGRQAFCGEECFSRMEANKAQ